MNKVYQSKELFEQLRKIIILPDDAIEIDINIKIDSIPTIIIKKYVDNDIGDGYRYTITERFELRKIE